MDVEPRLEWRLQWLLRSSWRWSVNQAATSGPRDPSSGATRPPAQHKDPEPLRRNTAIPPLVAPPPRVGTSPTLSTNAPPRSTVIHGAPPADICRVPIPRLAVAEAEQVFALLEAMPSPQGASPPRGVVAAAGAATSGGHHLGGGAGGSLAVSFEGGKSHPHHVRYLAAACRSAAASKCVFYLERATEDGSQLARTELALHLLHGWGVATDVPRALGMLDDAVGAHHPGAMLAVADCLRHGTGGINVDGRGALAWCRRAADLDYAPAMHYLAEWWENGGGGGAAGGGPFAVERDLVAAMRLYKAAAAKEYAGAQLNLAKLFLMGARMSLDHAVGEAEGKAQYWLSRAAGNGSVEARSLLSNFERKQAARDGRI